MCAGRLERCHFGARIRYKRHNPLAGLRNSYDGRIVCPHWPGYISDLVASIRRISYSVHYTAVRRPAVETTMLHKLSHVHVVLPVIPQVDGPSPGAERAACIRRVQAKQVLQEPDDGSFQ